MNILKEFAKTLLEDENFAEDEEILNKIINGEKVNLYNPIVNVMLGTIYLGELNKTFNGNLVNTLAGYNAGPGAVKNGKAFTYEQTRNYIRAVPALYEKEKRTEDITFEAKATTTPALNAVA